jgi:hypothetical protein
MKDKTLLFFVLLATTVALLVCTVPTAVLAAYNTTDVDVNVSELSQITLYPSYLNWTLITVGTSGGNKSITLKNTGSVNVSSIYAWVDTLADEATRPYGSSSASSYAAGGVLAIANETSDRFYYLGKLEWNWTEDIPNHDWSAVTTPVSWGYFRNMSNDYVWLLGSGTGGRCNESDAQFAIETAIDTGAADTRNPVGPILMTPSPDERWGYAAIGSGTLSGYCVAAYHDCSKIYIYNFDKRTNFTGCGNTDLLVGGQFAPGQTTVLTVNAWVPRGIPAGNLTRATLTVEAT